MPCEMYRTVVSSRSGLPWIEHTRVPGSGVRDQICHSYTNSSMIQLLSGDGFSVTLPIPLVLASSPLVRSVLAQQHHCGTVSISLPSAGGSILILLVEILRSGETSALSGYSNSCQKLISVQAVLDMLQCSVKITQNNIAETRSPEEAAGNSNNVSAVLVGGQRQSQDEFSSAPSPTDFTGSSTSSSSKLSCMKSEENSVLSPGEISIKLELEEQDAHEDSKILVIDARLEDILFSPKDSPVHESPLGDANKKEKVEDMELCCPFCQRVLKTQKSLKQHMLLRHAEPLHECEKCDSSFPSKKELNKHTKVAHFKFQCKSCHLTFKTKSRLCTHLQLAHLENPNLKRETMFAPRPRLELNEQLEWEHDDKRFSCDTCLKIFRTKESFMNHCNKLYHDPTLVTSFKMPRYKKFM